MAISKVLLNGTTLIDLTSDTVAANKILLDYTAHDASGEAIAGTMTGIPVLTVDENGYLVLNDEVDIEDLHIISSNDIGTILESGFYRIPEGYYVDLTYLIPETPLLVYNWDLTQGFTDTINGAVITASGATRSSSGLSFSSSSDYATIPVKYRPHHTYEFDISSMSKGSLSTHGRLIMMNTTEGLIYRNGANWATYLNGTWGSNGSSDSAAMSGHTLAMTVANAEPKFYIDGTLFYTGNKTQYLNRDDNIMIGSSSGQSYFDMTITGVRVYEGVKYS